MSGIASRFRITYNLTTSGPRQGKNCEDGMRAVDKHTLCTKKYFKQSDDEEPDFILTAHEIIKSNKVNSMAEECYYILMFKYDVKLQSDHKLFKGEKKNIKTRYWHVRGIDEKIESYRCQMVNFPLILNALYVEISRYHFSAEYFLGTVEMRKIPCTC